VRSTSASPSASRTVIVRRASAVSDGLEFCCINTPCASLRLSAYGPPQWDTDFGTAYRGVNVQPSHITVTRCSAG
jgi:hypothetical protein